MDDKDNGTYSRIPELKDLVSICQHLNENNIKYMVIGGFAVAFHGFARGTKDIDFLVDASVENIRRIKTALSFLPDNAIQEIQETDIEKYNVVRVADEVVIDLIGRACQIDYEEASKFIEYKEIQGVKIPVASKEILIRMKDTIRPSDKTDVQFLKAVLDEEKNKK